MPDPLDGTPFEEAPPAPVIMAPSMILPMQGIEIEDGGALPGDLGQGTKITFTNVYGARAQLICADQAVVAIIGRLQDQLRQHKAASGAPGIILPNGRTAPR